MHVCRWRKSWWRRCHSVQRNKRWLRLCRARKCRSLPPTSILTSDSVAYLRIHGGEPRPSEHATVNYTHELLQCKPITVSSISKPNIHHRWDPQAPSCTTSAERHFLPALANAHHPPGAAPSGGPHPPILANLELQPTAEHSCDTDCTGRQPQPPWAHIQDLQPSNQGTVVSTLDIWK